MPEGFLGSRWLDWIIHPQCLAASDSPARNRTASIPLIQGCPQQLSPPLKKSEEMESYHPATSIFQFLTHPNPPIVHPESSNWGNTTKGNYLIPARMKKWEDFDIRCLEKIGKGRLHEEVHRANRSLPYPALTDLDDAEVNGEPGTREVFSSWNRKVVTTALKTVDDIFNTVVWRVDGNRVNAHILSPPEVGVERVQPSRESSVEARRPPRSKATWFRTDSGSAIRGSGVERFVKEYKCGSHWTSDEFFAREPLDENGFWKKEKGAHRRWAWPVRQAYTYCVKQNCRYGCILSCKEAFVFRISAIKRNEGGHFIPLLHQFLFESCWLPTPASSITANTELE